MKDTADFKEKKITIIGGGEMGGALARGLLKSSGINGVNLTLSEPTVSKLKDLEDSEINITTDNISSINNADLIVVAVKPWIVDSVIEEITPFIDYENQELCFILAGIKPEILKNKFKTQPKNLCIAMPNTAMSVLESMTFLVPINGLPAISEYIFKEVGKVMIIEPRLLPGAMSLASCGIAYALRYVRAACEGGVELGFRASEAQAILTQTLAGVVKILQKDGVHPEAEIDKVTTPGGITIKGLNAMEKSGFTSAVIEGLKASANA